jgi:hypothetical protein
MQVLQNFSGLKIGNNFLQGEYELSSGGLSFVLFFDLIEGGSAGRFFPIWFWKF